jgi:hypothetical protein
MVGERGFEPPTPWSRTRDAALPGFTRNASTALFYWFLSFIDYPVFPDLFTWSPHNFPHTVLKHTVNPPCPRNSPQPRLEHSPPTAHQANGINLQQHGGPCSFSVPLPGGRTCADVKTPAHDLACLSVAFPTLPSTVTATSVVTLKPAIRGHFKTGHRDWPET